MSVLGQIGGFGKGLWDGAKSTYEGVKDVVTDPVGAANGIKHAVTHPGEALDAFTKPYRDAWSKGEYGQAIGRATFEGITAVVGTKGVDKLAKAAKAAKVARAAEAVEEVGAAAKLAKTAEVVEDAGKLATAATKGVTQSAEAVAATDKALSHVPGAARLEAAAAYRPQWASASLEDAVKRLGAVDVEATQSGKVLYTSKETGARVVHDPHSQYFRIEDPSIAGKRKYLDAEGKPVPNNVTDPVTGKQKGLSADEYNRLTHFKID